MKMCENNEELKARVSELVQAVDFKKADYVHMYSVSRVGDVSHVGDNSEKVYTVRFGQDELVLCRRMNPWRDDYAYVKGFNGKNHDLGYGDELRVPLDVVDELDRIVDERAKWKDDSLLRGLARLAKA